MKTTRYKVNYQIASSIYNNYKGYEGTRIADAEDIENLLNEGYEITVIKQLGSYPIINKTITNINQL